MFEIGPYYTAIPRMLSPLTSYLSRDKLYARQKGKGKAKFCFPVILPMIAQIHQKPLACLAVVLLFRARAVTRLRQRRRPPPLILGQKSKHSRMQESTMDTQDMPTDFASSIFEVWPRPWWACKACRSTLRHVRPLDCPIVF